MQITLSFKLEPDAEQEKLIEATLCEYIRAVNSAMHDYVKADKSLGYTSKDIQANLPSAVKDQVRRDTLSMSKMWKKRKKKNQDAAVPTAKKPIAVWNNQNYRIKDGFLIFPVWLDKSRRLRVKALLSDYQKKRLDGKKGTMRIVRKNGKLMAQVAAQMPEPPSRQDKPVIIGVDLGLKVPAVVAVSNHNVKFFGNGRENKFVRRRYKKLRQKLGKTKKQKQIKKISNKEQRWMKDRDHKLSREIINFAKDNSVTIIRLESLKGIRNTTRTSRKNAKNLHNWSFYRLSMFIEYKAKLAGIKVEYVNPAYTSQTCPMCGQKNKARDRQYQCKCGYHTHRDLVGAINIQRSDTHGVAV